MLQVRLLRVRSKRIKNRSFNLQILRDQRKTNSTTLNFNRNPHSMQEEDLHGYRFLLLCSWLKGNCLIEARKEKA